MGILLIDTRGQDWSRASAFLLEQAGPIQQSGSYLYIQAEARRLAILERLVLDLKLEEFCYILQPGEDPPAGAARVALG